MSAAARLEAILGGSRAAADRIAPLTEDERAAYRATLLAMANGAEPVPSPALDRLEALDLIGRDEDGRVVVAYPFSAHPTRDRVTLDDGRAVWAMCALDALGIPPMLGRAGSIAGGGGAITVELVPGTQPNWSPATAVVLVATAGEGSVADSCCPNINFFADAAAAERHLAQRDGLRGAILTMPEAIEGARLLFGDLLERLSR